MFAQELQTDTLLIISSPTASKDEIVRRINVSADRITGISQLGSEVAFQERTPDGTWYQSEILTNKDRVVVSFNDREPIVVEFSGYCQISLMTRPENVGILADEIGTVPNFLCIRGVERSEDQPRYDQITALSALKSVASIQADGQDVRFRQMPGWGKGNYWAKVGSGEQLIIKFYNGDEERFPFYEGCLIHLLK